MIEMFYAHWKGERSACWIRVMTASVFLLVFFGPKFGKSRSPKLDPDANDNRAENHWGLKSPLSDYRPEFTQD